MGETPMPRSSAPAIRRIAPRRDEQRHVVRAGGVVDVEHDGYHVEEPLGIGMRAGGEVPADVEDQAIRSALHAVPREQWGGRAAVVVRLDLHERASVTGIADPEQLDAHAGRGLAVGGVEHVRGELAAAVHRFASRVMVPLINPYGSSVATKMSFSNFNPNGSRLNGMRCRFGNVNEIESIAEHAARAASPMCWIVCCTPRL